MVHLINALCKGALGKFLNFFLPSLQLESKVREGSKTKRVYGPAQTPLERVLQSQQVSEQKKQELRENKSKLNPFALRREIDKALKKIDKERQLKA